jgi:hypothetical protein
MEGKKSRPGRRGDHDGSGEYNVDTRRSPAFVKPRYQDRPLVWVGAALPLEQWMRLRSAARQPRRAR